MDERSRTVGSSKIKPGELALLAALSSPFATTNQQTFTGSRGPVSLYGTMVGADQDDYLWTVTDNDARKRWTFHLNGEPGALTIVDVSRLEYAENGVLAGTPGRCEW